MGDYDLKVQILMIGDSGVGKTSLIEQYSSGTYSSDYITSIGVDFKTKHLNIEGKKIRLQIWDTAGQERFRTITASYYRRAEGILLVYDVTDKSSFASINSWIKQIEQSVDSETTIDMVLVGNKVDKGFGKRVTYDEGLKLAKSFNFPFFETSAKSGINVSKAFDLLSGIVTKRLLSETKKGSASGGDKVVKLNRSSSNSSSSRAREGGSCC